MVERGVGARTTLAWRADARAGGAGERPAPPQPGAGAQRTAATRRQALHGREAPPQRSLQPELRRSWRLVCIYAQFHRFGYTKRE